MAQWNYTLSTKPARVHAAVSGARAAAKVAFDSVSRRTAPNAKLRAAVVPKPNEISDKHAEAQGHKEGSDNGHSNHHCQKQIGWAKLLKRVFEIDMGRCPNYGSGALKIIAAITEQRKIEKILTHLGLEARAPPRAGVRQAEMF